MQSHDAGRYRTRLASSSQDVRAAQRLRWLCFMARNEPAAEPPGDRVDSDAMDDQCQHMLIEDRATGQLVCCFRFLTLENGGQIARSYSAQFYDLRALESFDGPMIEMGRFCIRPQARNPNILRVAWTALSRHVDQAGIRMLFGCSSFVGTEPDDYAEAFAILRDRHLAPRRWWPRVKAPRVVRFARALGLGTDETTNDARRAMDTMPPLLRGYLAMGGWVSDHAVVDPVLRTMHVFTGVEISAIPPARRIRPRGVPAA